MRPTTREFLIALTAAATLTACGGSDGGGNPPPSSGNPPAPTPTPPPPPSPSTTVPPISATVQDITDNHRIGTPRWGNPETDGTPIGTFTCVVNPPQTYHVHSHVSILVNNEAQALPAFMGSADTPTQGHCLYPIHSHDESGKIHVEGTAPFVATLGNLFQLWNQPLTNTNIAGISGLPIEVFVTENGVVTRVEEADWSAIELKDHREITIGLGTPVAEIPNITWN